MPVRAKQVAAVTAGLLVATVMAMLGLWQMSAYEDSTRDLSAERAAAAPTPLADSVHSDGAVADVYGRRVTLRGEYLPMHEVLAGDSDAPRVVTVFKMEDGRHVAVVRGTTMGSPAAAPTGAREIEGIFLAPDKPSPAGKGVELGSVRVQELAQRWPAPLIAGYVTLGGEQSRAQGLGQAAVELPEAEGSATHRGYALQWWVFAAGAVAFGLYAAQRSGKKIASHR